MNAEAVRENERSTVSDIEAPKDLSGSGKVGGIKLDPQEASGCLPCSSSSSSSGSPSSDVAVPGSNRNSEADMSAEVDLRDIKEVTAVLAESYDYSYCNQYYDGQDDADPEWQISLLLKNGSITETAASSHIHDMEYLRKHFDNKLLTPMTMRTLPNLMNFLKDKQPDEFPCSSFAFLGGRLDNQELQEFLKSLGPMIKKLSLDVYNCDMDDSISIDETPVHDLKVLLEVLAPNIETLHLEELPGEWEELPGDQWQWQEIQKVEQSNMEDKTRLFHDDTQLLNLKVLEIPKETPQWLVSEFKRVATNLEELSLF